MMMILIGLNLNILLLLRYHLVYGRALASRKMCDINERHQDVLFNAMSILFAIHRSFDQLDIHLLNQH